MMMKIMKKIQDSRTEFNKETEILKRTSTELCHWHGLAA